MNLIIEMNDTKLVYHRFGRALMSLFSYLLIGHLIGDFLFQTTWMAMFKTTKWVPLIVHCVSIPFRSLRLLSSGMVYYR